MDKKTTDLPSHILYKLVLTIPFTISSSQSMGTITPSPIMPQPLPPHSSPKPTISFLYYGLALVTAAAFVLIIYNLFIVRWCVYSGLTRTPHRAVENSQPSSSQSFDNSRIRQVSTFKYKKEKGVHYEGEYDCPICLSVFEEGEEVRQILLCKHSFHAPCIDMWLYPHANCPVCRTSLELPMR